MSSPLDYEGCSKPTTFAQKVDILLIILRGHPLLNLNKGRTSGILFRSFLVSGLFSGVVNILALSGPLFMLEVYDRVIPSRSVPTLVALLILIVGLYAFSGILDIIRGRVMARIAGIRGDALSVKLLTMIAGAPLKSKGGGGDILRPVQDADQITAFLAGPGPSALFDLPWMPVYLAICFFLNPLIGWLAAAAMMILIGLTILTDLLTRSRTVRTASALATRNRFGEAAYRNAEAIAAMGLQDQANQRWCEAYHAAAHLQRQTNDIAGLLGGISKVVRQMVQSGSLALGAWLVIEGELTGGAIVAASIIVARALQPIEQVIANWRNMTAASQAWRRLQDMAKLYPDDRERITIPAPVRALAVEAIFAGPPGEKRMTVRNISLRVEAGSVVGIIGPSASGKSSLVRAITGVWPLARGKVRLDGASLDQWPAADRGHHIGYMPQSSDLFPGTVAENIARLDRNAAHADIVAAAQAAGARDMILALPDGYETQVGDGGANLSAGQRQRVALARALYGEPFLVVLDEPNANLDADGDAALSHAMAGVRHRGGIVLVVAHRNSVLSQLDLLLVMENGVAKAFGPRDVVLQSLQQGQSHGRSTLGPSLTVIGGEGSQP
ncbi:type I secretion system permease/ATPase [Agrobacterium tumefaciens]|uniref:type I secretion system permease/ATPase n=1 Tax=Agrobacterium tumefaciens TaxID=358 RepID=UPI001F38A038|nr:type I secretion system permease/ATPase [Agrobacterium tumefaciens]